MNGDEREFIKPFLSQIIGSKLQTMGLYEMNRTRPTVSGIRCAKTTEAALMCRFGMIWFDRPMTIVIGIIQSGFPQAL